MPHSGPSSESQLRTRIAPTPSGFLHPGNIANFLLVEKLAGADGVIRLRIDDCDSTRARPEFIEHIFATLRWLGIRWREGPQDADEFHRSHSQSRRKAHYFDRLQELGTRLFACACSRKEAEGGCSGRCRELRLPFRPGETALRLHLEDPALRQEHGDVVLWRKDDGPAYHLASVIDDLEQRINLIVRGEDLLGSSALQCHLARLFEPGGFSGVRFVHHPLLLGVSGAKLSKSGGAASVEARRLAGETGAQLRAELFPVLRSWNIA